MEIKYTKKDFWLAILAGEIVVWLSLPTLKNIKILGQGKVSPDLAGDFIDYFVFGGSGARLSEQLGIRGFSVKYDKNKKGLEVKKAISDKLEASYGVEQSQAKEQQLKTTQKERKNNYCFTSTMADKV